MGAARTVRTLNQRDGFDCPGCGWPEPDDHRRLAEFCENGAKAVAEEATRRRVGPEFLAEQLRGLSTPDEAVFYTSGRTSNEARA